MVLAPAAIVGLQPVQHGVDLADGGVAPVHFLAEVSGRGGVLAASRRKSAEWTSMPPEPQVGS